MSRYCFLCGEKLVGKQISKEHIIKNSLGGRKKTKTFICIVCNGKTGKEWDDKIDKLFGEYLALLFGISRERGDVPHKKVTDKETNVEYFLKNGKIINVEPSFTYHEATGKITITAKDSKRAKQYLNQLKSENKIPNNTEFGKTERVETREKIVIDLKFTIPELDSDFSRSIVKSALALLSENKKALDSCQKTKEFLLNKGAPCLNYLYTYDPIKNRRFATPFHCVHVFSYHNTLVAYVELYSIARYYISLSEQYTGNKINVTYAVNPRTGEELDINIEFNSSNMENPVTFNKPGELMFNLLEEINFKRAVILSFHESTEKALLLQETVNLEVFGHDIGKFFLPPLLKKLERTTNKDRNFEYMTTKFKLLLSSLYASLAENKI